VPVRLQPLRGDWLPLDPDQTTTLGRSGRNRELGRSAVLGRRVWDQAAGLRLTLGPLPGRTLAGFLPGTRGSASLCTLLAFALDGAFAVELVLLKRPDPRQAARLGRAARLGWTAWLGAGTPAPVQLRLPAGLPA
jgi:type VI secretion system protein ImpH